MSGKRIVALWFFVTMAILYVVGLVYEKFSTVSNYLVAMLFMMFIIFIFITSWREKK